MSRARSSCQTTFCGIVCACCVMAMLLSGCKSEDKPPAVEITQAAGYLPRLTSTKNEELAALLEDLSNARELPQHLRGTPVPKENNAAPSLEGLIPEGARKQLFDETLAFYPLAEPTFSATNWEQAVRFLEKHDSTRTSARAAIVGKECDFQIDHTQALTVDLSVVYSLHAMARLEGIYAIGQLKANNLPASLEAVNVMLAFSRCLDQQLHIPSRLQAVHIRTDALFVLEAICQSELTTASTLQTAKQMIAMLIEHWPDEQEAWRSDRAMSLICYEYARGGSITNVLTPEELERIAEDDTDALARFKEKQVDADAVSYLNAMQHVIDQCDQPLFRREGIALQLPPVDPKSKNRDKPRFSLAQILLESVPKGESLFAWDRARTEAWQIALAEGLGEPPPAFQISPLSGQPYTVIDRDETIAVWGVGANASGPDRPVVIRKLR